MGGTRKSRSTSKPDRRPTRDRNPATDLTDLEARFVEELLAHPKMEGQAAAIAAGATPKSARVWASRARARPRVKAAIEKALAARAKRVQITQDEVLAEYRTIAFSNVTDFLRIENGDIVVDMEKLVSDRSGAVSKIIIDEVTTGVGKNRKTTKKVKLELHDKKGALDSVARHLGMFTEKLRFTDGEGNDLAFTVKFVSAKES